uniref:ATP synthase complex subunit 8 n=1 Tax=Bahadzia jaraguensis TaxID=1041811 RepID=K7ZTS9_BAHJA|nr:ATP synthase F0 subunit 8 [Bahadzia jaraguensis]
MPQMAPILWLPLFLFISLIIFLIINFLYFSSSSPKNNNFNATEFTKPLHWQW